MTTVLLLLCVPGERKMQNSLEVLTVIFNHSNVCVCVCVCVCVINIYSHMLCVYVKEHA